MASIVRVEWVRLSSLGSSDRVFKEYGSAQELTVTGSTITSTSAAPIFTSTQDGFARITVLSGQVYATSGTSIPGTLAASGCIRIGINQTIFMELNANSYVSFIEATGYDVEQYKTTVNITSATVIKSTPGVAYKISVIVAGSAAGTLNDCTTTAAVASSNVICAIPNTVGIITPEWNTNNGIVIVPGTGQTLAIAYL